MLISIFSSITNFFNLIVAPIKFVISYFSDTVKVVFGLGQVFQGLPSYISFLPAVLSTALSSAFVVLLILRVVGRD